MNLDIAVKGEERTASQKCQAAREEARGGIGLRELVWAVSAGLGTLRM